MLAAYRQHVEECAALGVVPKPLDAEQTAQLVELLKSPPKGEDEFLLDLLTNTSGEDFEFHYIRSKPIPTDILQRRL